MTLDGFVLFTLGALVEWTFLLAINTRLDPVLLPGAHLYERMFTPTRMVAIFLGVIALCFIGLFELLGIGRALVYIDTPGIGLVWGVLALGVVASALFVSKFLPLVNEQSILLVQVLVLAGALWGGEPVAWLPDAAVTVVPVGVSLALVIWRGAFHPSVKAILYFWYLVSLLVGPFQSGETGLFQLTDLSWPESYSFGMLSVFLLLNILMALRFGLIVLSMIRPRNRAMVAASMPYLFTDRQVSMPRYLLVVLLISALLIVNQSTQVLDRGVAFSLCSLIGVQLLSQELQPPRPSPELGSVAKA